MRILATTESKKQLRASINKKGIKGLDEIEARLLCALYTSGDNLRGLVSNEDYKTVDKKLYAVWIKAKENNK